MKQRIGTAFAVAFVASLAPQAAFAQPTGWYIGLGGGYGTMSYTLTTPSSSLESDTDWARRGIVMLGYKHASGFRAELEPNYGQYRVNDTPGVGVGTITTYGGFANLLYDLAILPRVNLVLGGGVDWMRMNADIVEPPAGVLTVAGGSKTGFAWQAIAGVSAALSHNAEIQLDYRYGALPSGAFNTDFPLLAPTRLNDIRTQVAMLSLRWYPGMQRVEQPAPLPLPPPPPPPPPLSRPPAPPPPPPPMRTFIVFFDFDKWNLTVDAQQVVAQAVRTAQSVGVVRIVVTGHTDTAHARPGSAQAHAYNQALSERRALAVKDEMVRYGMNPGEIATIGQSSDDPLVATGPGVREPQNRRAVIELR
jgi:outer membrane protein OmpA-like peptidoglycan-associated protein/opacity protein-like surface antigen